jgi:acetoin utilization protein AcuB
MWMTRPAISVPPETPISEVALLMVRRSIRHVIVASDSPDGPRLAGIVSAQDVARAYPPDLNPFSAEAVGRPIKRPVSEVMTQVVQTVTPEVAIERAARVLVEQKIGALPVVSNGRPIGIVTSTDVMRAFLELGGEAEHGVRITFDVTETEDAVATARDAGKRNGLELQSLVTLHHDGRRLAVARFLGPNADGFVSDVWRSGHRVVSIVSEEANDALTS